MMHIDTIEHEILKLNETVSSEIIFEGGDSNKYMFDEEHIISIIFPLMFN